MNKPFSDIGMIEERYALENAIINAVTAGNEAVALEYLDQFSNDTLPWRLPDKLRDIKNYIITTNTLLRKAVESAGVHPIHIDAYSNSIIPAIERLSTVRQGQLFTRQLIKGYCQLVHEYLYKTRSPLIGKILAYIDIDLSADLSLKTLAKYLGINASYLSALFSREMEISLTDYVNLRRIDLAKKLLAGTNLPIKFIARQCGFPDIHYFSRLFKRITDTTPRAYRESTQFQNPGEIERTIL